MDHTIKTFHLNIKKRTLFIFELDNLPIPHFSVTKYLKLQMPVIPHFIRHSNTEIFPQNLKINHKIMSNEIIKVSTYIWCCLSAKLFVIPRVFAGFEVIILRGQVQAQRRPSESRPDACRHLEKLIPANQSACGKLQIARRAFTFGRYKIALLVFQTGNNVSGIIISIIDWSFGLIFGLTWAVSGN